MIVPSIDLMDGKAVQLRQGKEKVLEENNPIELAKKFNRYAPIAVIDLDAAMGKGDNSSIIRQICQTIDCRVGGGINTIEKAREIYSWGASKVIIGSKAFEGNKINHDFLSELASAIGREHIIIAVDSRNNEIVTKAWTKSTGMKLFDVVKDLEKYCSEFLFTCVEKEGMMQGADLKSIEALGKITSNKITAAGGITTIKEISYLSNLGIDSQIGMALYTGNISLEDAFIESLDWSNPLIPTITRDQSGQVLMLAYSNKDSLRKTFETGKVWYYSRSRKKLWMKGETSGNVQEFEKMRNDCDSDSILISAKQSGVACHLENYSCFGDKEFNLHDLYDVVTDRLEDKSNKKSYTASLTDITVREKIMEEAQEVVEAETKEEIIWEAADVIYFVTVLLAKSAVSINDVFNELKRRRIIK